MSKYICYRCGYGTNRKSGFKDHLLNRKNPCPALYMNMSPKEVLNNWTYYYADFMEKYGNTVDKKTRLKKIEKQVKKDSIVRDKNTTVTFKMFKKLAEHLNIDLKSLLADDNISDHDESYDEDLTDSSDSSSDSY